MEKENLTMESIMKRIEESIEWNLGGKAERKEKVLTESILIVQSFLKQIKEELLDRETYFENDDFFFNYVSLITIEELFNKYLNEK